MDYEMMASEQARGKGVKFERIRRITGYLVGTLDRFNSGKRAEECQRVKHGVSNLNMVEALADSLADRTSDITVEDRISA